MKTRSGWFTRRNFSHDPIGKHRALMKESAPFLYARGLGAFPAGGGGGWAQPTRPAQPGKLGREPQRRRPPAG